MKDKKMLLVILVTISLILILISYFVFFKEEKETNTDSSSSTVEQNSEELTPEQVLENMDKETVTDSIGENVTLTIVSPEGDAFDQGQARLWRAEFAGIETGASFKAKCHWDFYLNEYAEETLYEQMDNSSISSIESTKACGFTSTFIDSRGKLRVVLTAEVTNSYGKAIATYTAERNYTVE